MYCTKPLHHRYAKKKERTLPISGISEQHGIFFEGKKQQKTPKTQPGIKVGCLRPAVTSIVFSPNRPVLD